MVRVTVRILLPRAHQGLQKGGWLLELFALLTSMPWNDVFGIKLKLRVFHSLSPPFPLNTLTNTPVIERESWFRDDDVYVPGYHIGEKD